MPLPMSDTAAEAAEASAAAAYERAGTADALDGTAPALPLLMAAAVIGDADVQCRHIALSGA